MEKMVKDLEKNVELTDKRLEELRIRLSSS